jgi:elongator complex protein 2
MNEAPADDEVWTELGAISGHAGSVKSIAWSPDGEYLISAG